MNPQGAGIVIGATISFLKELGLVVAKQFVSVGSVSGSLWKPLNVLLWLLSEHTIL